MRVIRSVHSYAELLGWKQAVRLGAAWLLRRPTVDLDCNILQTTLRIRPRSSDRHAMYQVLFERDCDVPLQSPRLIVDAGANTGFATALLACRNPDATVVAIEPEDANIALLKHNCRRFSNVQVLQAGLWHRRAALAIVDPSAASWAFQLGEVHPDTPGALRAYSVADLLRMYESPHIDLFKLDIEGAELQLFLADTSWLDQVRVLVVEIHGPEAYRAVLAAVGRKGRSFMREQRGEKLVFHNRALGGPAY